VPEQHDEAFVFQPKPMDLQELLRVVERYVRGDARGDRGDDDAGG
jgi:hypothetical protein